jgi:hypothetical protein
MPMTSPSEPRPDSGTSSGRYKEDDDVWMSAVAGGVASGARLAALAEEMAALGLPPMPEGLALVSALSTAGGAPTLIAQYEQQIAAEKARRAATTP